MSREAMPSSHGRADSDEVSKSRRRRKATRNVSLTMSWAASRPIRRAANAPITFACLSKSSAKADGISIDRLMMSLSALTLRIAGSGAIRFTKHRATRRRRARGRIDRGIRS